VLGPKATRRVSHRLAVEVKAHQPVADEVAECCLSGSVRLPTACRWPFRVARRAGADPHRLSGDGDGGWVEGASAPPQAWTTFVEVAVVHTASLRHQREQEPPPLIVGAALVVHHRPAEAGRTVLAVTRAGS
jgi:hypothetical protein